MRASLVSNVPMLDLSVAWITEKRMEPQEHVEQWPSALISQGFPTYWGGLPTTVLGGFRQPFVRQAAP